MSTLAYFHLLADRAGAPAALLYAADADADGPDGLDGATLRALSGQLACFYRPQGPAPAALPENGWRALDPARVLRADLPLETAPAPAVAWIAGDWYLAPPGKPLAAQSASRALALQLVQLVARDADTHEIEALLRHDPTLSYHLLRLVNSGGVGNGRRVASFAQAILILGRQQLRRWLNLMLFAARERDARSAMLLARVAVRARALELLARECGLDRHTQELAFMCGMFSLLGVLFGAPLPELLAPLMVDEAVQAALLSRGGELGALLALLEAAEQERYPELARRLAALGLEAGQFHAAALAAHLWMLGVVGEAHD
ncbi:HDOD domain-containing protein [Janthinobacterium sp.]|uniref:HDOD domain-containing protein n=1 Tax=Janthinobacterium sp. TaxID=1871054 RepID=UPI00293D6955|nr:HDOD domain-containing protein [Janthinobacterium sp.]